MGKEAGGEGGGCIGGVGTGGCVFGFYKKENEVYFR